MPRKEEEEEEVEVDDDDGGGGNGIESEARVECLVSFELSLASRFLVARLQLRTG